MKVKIYQLKDEYLHKYGYESYEYITENNHDGVTPEMYYLVYETEMDDDTTLDEIFAKFNKKLPEEYLGHPLSMSDIVETIVDGEDEPIDKFYFVDASNYIELEDWIAIPEDERDYARIEAYGHPFEEKYDVVAYYGSGMVADEAHANTIDELVDVVWSFLSDYAYVDVMKAEGEHPDTVRITFDEIDIDGDIEQQLRDILTDRIDESCNKMDEGISSPEDIHHRIWNMEAGEKTTLRGYTIKCRYYDDQGGAKQFQVWKENDPDNLILSSRAGFAWQPQVQEFEDILCELLCNGAVPKSKVRYTHVGADAPLTESIAPINAKYFKDRNNSVYELKPHWWKSNAYVGLKGNPYQKRDHKTFEKDKFPTGGKFFNANWSKISTTPPDDEYELEEPSEYELDLGEPKNKLSPSEDTMYQPSAISDNTDEFKFKTDGDDWWNHAIIQVNKETGEETPYSRNEILTVAENYAKSQKILMDSQATRGFILPNGNVIGTDMRCEKNHASLERKFKQWLEEDNDPQFKFKCNWYPDGTRGGLLLDHCGCVRFNIPMEHYIALPESNLTYEQYDTLEEIINKCFNGGPNFSLNVCSFNGQTQEAFNWKHFSGSEVCDRIRKFYNTGKLDNSYNEAKKAHKGNTDLDEEVGMGTSCGVSGLGFRAVGGSAQPTAEKKIKFKKKK